MTYLYGFATTAVGATGVSKSAIGLWKMNSTELKLDAELNLVLFLTVKTKL